VWNELVEQALAIGQHADLCEEAHAVARELMKRVRQNADAVRATLREAGVALPAEEPPAGDAELARLAALGPLPIALEACWRIVGSIALVPAAGATADGGLQLAALDPLEVRGARAAAPEVDHYERRVAASHREIVGPLPLELARSAAAKRGEVGGQPSVVELPPPTAADAVDPRVHRARHRLRFVEYLRHSFRWGGFWVLEVAHRGEAAEHLLARLREHLVDF
jgi:hypothetical protein